MAGDRDRVRALISAGVDVSANDGEALKAARNSHFTAALTAAASQGHADIVADLLAAGAKPHNGIRSNTLHAAASHGHLGIARRLIEAGANANPFHGTPLYGAIDAGAFDVIRLLVSHGAHPARVDWRSMYKFGRKMPRTFDDVDPGDSFQIGMAIACFAAGRWTHDDIIAGCVSAAHIALVMKHHPEAVAIIEQLPADVRAAAMDSMVSP